MNKGFYYLLGTVVIVAFLILGFSSFKRSITPYVSFEEAKASGERVQIIGKLVSGSCVYDSAHVGLSFELASKGGETLTVIYSSGPKPANFEEATQIVVIGKYDRGEFLADQLLVKCPSKYQGTLE